MTYTFKTQTNILFMLFYKSEIIAATIKNLHEKEKSKTAAQYYSFDNKLIFSIHYISLKCH